MDTDPLIDDAGHAPGSPFGDAAVRIDPRMRELIDRRVLFSIGGHEWLSRETVKIRADDAPFQLVWLKGRGRLEGAEGKSTELRPGKVWTSARAGESVRLHLHPEAGGRGLKLSFAAPLAADYANYLARHFGPFAHLSATSRAIRAAGALARCLDEGASREQVSRRVFDWFTALHSALEERRLHLGELLSDKMERLPAIFETHGHTIKGLAEYLACSPTWLSQQLERAWKQPARDFLRTLRRRHARRLLATTSLGVGEVARRCGFADTASFATTFKKETGLRPSQARNGPPEQAGAPSRPPGATISAGFRPASRAGSAYSPVAVWGDAFFQFDGGVSDLTYETPFDLAFNAVTNAVYWVLTLEGEAVFEAGNHSLRTTPGMVVVYPQPMNGRWLTPGGRPWKRLWLNVRCQWGIEALFALGAAHGWAAMLPLDSRPVELARKWGDAWHRHRNEPSVTLSRAGFEWLQSWRALLCSGRVRPVVEAGGPALPDLRQLVSKAFFRKIKTITEYARQQGYSRRHITRKLRAQWDDGTPAQVIRRQRLAQAALDLRHTRLSVGEIARKAQYASTGSFIPAFKREFKTTPLAYRQAGV